MVPKLSIIITLQGVSIMLERSTKEQAGKNPQINEKLINQFHYLQQTIGNQEVQNLVNAGIIIAGQPEINAESIIRNENKKQDFEAQQIAADNAALEDEIKALMAQKKGKAEALVNKNQDKPVYANITTELIYARIPGDNALEFYHYTKLKDVDFSLRNINETQDPVYMNRGKSITAISSVLVTPELPVLAPNPKKENKKEAEKELAEKPKEEVIPEEEPKKVKIEDSDAPTE